MSDSRSVLGKREFVGLLATNFVLGLPAALVVPFVSLWATREVGMSPEVLGLFMTINSLSSIALSTVIARWSDTFVTRRRLLLVGALGGALGNVGYAFLREPLLLTLVGSTLLALGTINFAQLFAHVREELARPEHTGADVPLVMGVLRACYALSWTVGPVLGARIMEELGYRGIFLSAASLLTVLIGFVFLFVAERPHAARAPGEEKPVLPWGFGQPIVMAHCAAFALMFAALTLNTMNLPLYLTEKLGGDAGDVGTAFAISPLFEILFMVGFGHVASRGYQLAVVRFGLLAAVAYFLALRAVDAPSEVYPLQILNAAGVAVTTSVAIPLFQDLMPGQAGVATNLYSNALKVGGLIGFSTFGFLARRIGNSGLLLVCAALTGTALVILLFARRRVAARAPLSRG